MEQNQINLSQLTEIELKAFAYDEINKLEMARNNLKTINQELLNRQVGVNSDEFKNITQR
jgi:hypothetical protein